MISDLVLAYSNCCLFAITLFMQDSQIIINCPHCQKPMDVSTLAPFSNAVCPFCEGCTRVNATMGNYVIINKLGIGGMSVVYRAEDKMLNRVVALKVLNETYANNEDRVLAFEKEAKVMAKVSHEHLVKIYGVGREYGRFYIAMELVDGMDMETRINSEGAFDEKECLDYMIQTVQGLEAAWDAGLIHRDIKPANILVDQDDHVKIVDFGLALLQDERQMEEEVWVTPYYAAPETLLRSEEDFRTDMYALGATMYHMLLGKPPLAKLPESSNELLEMKKQIAPIEELAPDLQYVTSLVVNKLLSFNREDRFDSYTELLEALRVAYADILTEGKLSPEERAFQRASLIRRYKRKKFAVYYYVGGGIIALLLLLLAGSFYFHKEEPVAVAPPSVTDKVPDRGKSAIEIRQDISREYLKARDYLKEGKFHEAASICGSLVDQKLCPLSMSVTCSIIETYCLWITGQYQLGTEALKKANKKIAQCKDASELASVSEFKPILESLCNDDINKPIPTTSGHGILNCLIYTGQALKSWYSTDWQDYNLYYGDLKDLQGSTDPDTYEMAKMWCDCLISYTHDVEMLMQFTVSHGSNLQSIESKLKKANQFKDRLSYETYYRTPTIRFVERLDFLIRDLTDRQRIETERIEQEKRAEVAKITAAKEARQRELNAAERVRKNRSVLDIYAAAMKIVEETKDYQMGAKEFSVGVDDSEDLDKQLALSAYYDMFQMSADFLSGLDRGMLHPQMKNKVVALKDGSKVVVVKTDKTDWLVKDNKKQEKHIQISDISFDSIRAIAMEARKLYPDVLTGAQYLLVYAYLTKSLDAKSIDNAVHRMGDDFHKQWDQWMSAIDG